MYLYFLLGSAALLFCIYIMFNPGSFEDRDLCFALSSGLVLSMVGMIIEQHIAKAKSSAINSLYIAFSLCFMFWMLSLSLYM